MTTETREISGGGVEVIDKATAQETMEAEKRAMMRLGLVEFIARTCHEVNRAYCESTNDFSQVQWEQAPDWQRDSARNGVEAILKNPTMTPEQSHESWMAEKEAHGWVYGETKDAELKVHPCMVPYAELPAAQRLKDHLFGAVVRSLRELVD